MDKVAVFIKKYSIGKSSPILCLLDLLSDNYEVDLFLQEAWHMNATVFEKDTIKLITVEGRKENNSIKIIKNIWDFLFGKNYKNITTIDYNRNYKSYICFDPHGFFLCKELFPRSMPFYYSLELYLKNDHFNLEYPEEVMKKEKDEINTIKGLIIQSQEREHLFRKEYNLSDSVPALILPVTYMQSSVKDKSSLLRGKYDIDKNKKIALHLGGIQEYFSCIELALTFSKLENWVLIFHGCHYGEYIRKLKNTIKKNGIKNVYISDEFCERIEDMDAILMSCDVGIAWYNNVSLNFSTAGKSSGKISAYLKFGLPVIAKRYHSTIEAIEDTGCGVCVESFDEIGDAISQIENNYNQYSKNALDEFDRTYRFENYMKEIIDFIERP
ncbi:MAG: hypothetical protein A2Y97_12590 [Nitrospirae bacterium RBG_13_39_12]|nr:MAG: hypothetical protein A2Y97_12590 [Nitrospirae bacterium RBG_13_39_12]